jgi:hypothetical protein
MSSTSFNVFLMRLSCGACAQIRPRNWAESLLLDGFAAFFIIRIQYSKMLSELHFKMILLFLTLQADGFSL